MSLDDLLERVEKAEGPDRELDEGLARAFGWSAIVVDHFNERRWTEWRRPVGFNLPIGTLADPPFFTASLDAVLDLAPLAGLHPLDLYQQAGEDMANGGWRDDKPFVPQIALYALAAMLRALIAQESNTTPPTCSESSGSVT